jgi:hypothetical protein
MASPAQISTGQRYQEVQQRNFNRPGLVWIVQDCLTGSDGIAYARLVSARDPSQFKTLSLAVLGERHRFLRIAS